MLSIEVIQEFWSALTARETYDPRRNTYIIFGLLWGLPVPALGLLLEARYSSSGLASPWDPLHILLALHPLFFAVVFGALGTIRLRKTARIEDLLNRLAEEVRRLARANTELQELDRFKDEFLGNVTHELKTPLVTIRGYTAMLESQRLGALNDKQRRAIQVMHKNAMRLQEQIDRLLSCSRNKEHIKRLVQKKIQLASLLREVHDRHIPASEAKGVQLIIEEPDEPQVLLGDRERLVEVIDNLISNAIKFTEEGGAVRLTFGAPEKNKLPAEVSDTGCGIAPESLDVIFDRFRQADGSISRRYGGSGLGLAIVRANLEAHGCSVRVESEEGRGTRFLFDLPLAPPAHPHR